MNIKTYALISENENDYAHLTKPCEIACTSDHFDKGINIVRGKRGKEEIVKVLVDIQKRSV